MCGIIGYIGSKPVVPVLLDGLRRMEYRGYDSAGVALVSPEGISLRRSAGKLANLENVIRIDPVDGVYGVGHTRWATHGRPTEENAHPHRDCTGRIVVVHNGIVGRVFQFSSQFQSQFSPLKGRLRRLPTAARVSSLPSTSSSTVSQIGSSTVSLRASSTTAGAVSTPSVTDFL